MTNFLKEFAEKQAKRAKPTLVAKPPLVAKPTAAPINTLAPEDRRTDRRIDVELTAVLHFESDTLLCTTSDLSAGGVKLQLKKDPFKNVRINIANFGDIDAEVVWKDGEYVGLKFDEDNSEIISALARMIS